MTQHDIKQFILRRGVSGALRMFAGVLREMERNLEGVQPASVAREMQYEYRYASKVVEQAATRIKYHANRAGF